MRIPWLADGLILAALTLPLSQEAGADMLPENYKGVKLSVKVELAAEMPEGKLLVLANTFQGADPIRPGEVKAIDWHPLGGEMQLRLIDAAQAAQLGALRDKRDRDSIEALIRPGLACSPSFAGVRAIRESSSAEEVRWTLRARPSADACSGEILRMDYLNAEGVPVPTPDDAPPGSPLEGSSKTEDAPPKELASPKEIAPEPAKDPTSAARAQPEPSPASGGCGCTTDSDAPLGLGLLGLLLGAGLRRRR